MAPPACRQAANAEGTKTLVFRAEDVHDFAWTADPGTKIVEDTVQISSGTAKLRLLMQPGHMKSAPRYMDALKGTMKKFDEWIGPYPYSQVTVVDPRAAWNIPRSLRPVPRGGHRMV